MKNQQIVVCHGCVKGNRSDIYAIYLFSNKLLYIQQIQKTNFVPIEFQSLHSEGQFILKLCTISYALLSPCGVKYEDNIHSFRGVYIKAAWDQSGSTDCHRALTPRRVLHRNTILAEVVH